MNARLRSVGILALEVLVLVALLGFMAAMLALHVLTAGRLLR